MERSAAYRSNHALSPWHRYPGFENCAFRAHRDSRANKGQACGLRPGKIGHRVGHVGGRIEQAAGITAIAERARGAEPDLHQTVVAAIDRARIEIAFAPDNET